MDRAQDGECATTSEERISLTIDDVASFEYLNEGNAHCVFEYRGPAHERGPRVRLERALLRVRKTQNNRRWQQSALDAAVWDLATRSDEDVGVGESWVAADRRARDEFYRDAPKLVSEVSDIEPCVVEFSSEFIAGLASKYDAAERLERRRRDGQSVDVAERFGQLSRVAARAHSCFSRTQDVFLVEIKPKSGVAVTLDDGKEVSRYQLHQRLKLARGERKMASAYDPLDLFSGDKLRIQTAISALFACPQNNLRICDGDFNVLMDESGAKANTSLDVIQAALPGMIDASADVFAHILRVQSRDCIGYARAHVLAAELKDDLTNLTAADGALLRDFVVSQIAKDCSVLFTVIIDNPVEDINVRTAAFVDAARQTHTCAFTPQIIDVSAKTLDKTGVWRALDDDILDLARANEV